MESPDEIIIRTTHSTKTIKLFCGHETSVDHRQGERGISCPHCGVPSIVEAYTPPVSYRVRPGKVIDHE